MIRNTQALLWPQTFDWRACVVNIGDAAAAPTTVRVYSGARELDTKAVETEIAAGAEWRMSDFTRRDRPSVGERVRICVDPVPGETDPNRANNYSSATVERNRRPPARRGKRHQRNGYPDPTGQSTRYSAEPSRQAPHTRSTKP